jgi:hypothetical protein
MVGQSDWLPMMMATSGFSFGTRGSSGDDIGNEQVFDLLNLVLEAEFHFLEPAKLKLISRSGCLERLDSGIEIAVLLQQGLQLCPKLNLLQRVHHPQAGTDQVRLPPRFDLFNYALAARSTSPQLYVIILMFPRLEWRNA